MDDHPMMKCGHAANAVCNARGGIKYDPPVPSCAICSCIDIDDAPPALEGRTARCYCGKEQPSDMENLAFFEYCGPGSREATEICKCGYHRIAHEKEDSRIKCNGFTPKGPQPDRYYCGHAGWD